MEWATTAILKGKVKNYLFGQYHIRNVQLAAKFLEKTYMYLFHVCKVVENVFAEMINFYRHFQRL